MFGFWNIRVRTETVVATSLENAFDRQGLFAPPFFGCRSRLEPTVRPGNPAASK